MALAWLKRSSEIGGAITIVAAPEAELAQAMPPATTLLPAWRPSGISAFPACYNAVQRDFGPNWQIRAQV